MAVLVFWNISSTYDLPIQKRYGYRNGITNKNNFMKKGGHILELFYFALIFNS